MYSMVSELRAKLMTRGRELFPPDCSRRTTMPQDVTGPTARGVAGLQMEERVVQALREQLPVVATQTVAAVVREVPGYTGALSASMSDNIEAAVTMALGGF